MISPLLLTYQDEETGSSDPFLVEDSNNEVELEDAEEANSFVASETRSSAPEALRKKTLTREGKKMAVKDRRENAKDAGLDEAVKEFERVRAADLSAADRASLREFLRLGILYPREHVAFRDIFEGEGDSLRLVRRDVLCHSRSLAVVQRYLNRLPKHERDTVALDYIEAPKTSRRR